MCIVFVCRGAGLANHGYKFIMAANRDEVIRRPARQAAFWENNNLLAGCDLTPGYEGGTWLGVTRSGRVGFLTNIRQTPAQISAAGVKKGRGQLVTNFLLDEISTPLQYLQGIESERTSYSPFNLLVADINKDLYYLDSQSQNAARKIDTDFYCITNSVMEKPWLKQTNSLEKFKNVVTKTDHGQGLKESLFHMLTDQTKNFPDPYLEDNPMSRWLSSIYCEPHTPLPDYIEGFSTRASTVILVDKNDHVTFEERSKTRLEQLPSEWDEVSFEFQLQM